MMTTSSKFSKFKKLKDKMWYFIYIIQNDFFLFYIIIN
jgi:hypothetical protein